MPTLPCPGCGNKVTFEGVAGVCPNCASIVRVARAASAPKESEAQPARQRSRSVKMSDLHDLAAGEEIFTPSEVPGRGKGMDKGVLYTIIGTVAVVLIFTAYVIFSPKADDTASAPPPPPRIVRHVTPEAPPPPPETVVLAPQPADKLPTTTGTATTQQAVATRPSWFALRPAKPPLPEVPLTDQKIGKAIQSGVDYLIGQFSNGELTVKDPEADLFAGEDALCTYALLHAGQAITDSRLGVSGDLMKSALDRLKKFDMSAGKATYGRSLRASALALAGRDEDRSMLARDLDWLVKSAVKGAYTYSMPTPEQRTEGIQGDGSNSQYGVLGVWAASDADLGVPATYWTDVEKYWLANQTKDGAWAYQVGQNPSLTMTCAGITTLAVASEHRPEGMIAAQGKHTSHPPLTKALNAGVTWLGVENRLTEVPSYEGYAIYGVERAALATGFKSFGKHDWYRELGAIALQGQQKDGRWSGGQGDLVETPFHLLFLSRGRQPLVMNKLQFEGAWDNRPRDASKLTAFISSQLEQPFAWGVVDLTQQPQDWLDSPILFISTDTPPSFTDDDYTKLRAYTDQGGLIFLHNEWGTPVMNQWAADFAKKAFPEYVLQPLPADHLIYTTGVHLPVKSQPALKAISNGSRLLMIYSPTDITKDWVTRSPKGKNVQSEFGVNLFLYGAGKNGFRKRLENPYVPPSAVVALGTIPILRVQYGGAWDPEPWAWQRFPRWFQNETSLGLTVQPMSVEGLSPSSGPIAVMTGNAAIDFSTVNFRAVHDFVSRGGVLLIDSTGGNKAFIKSVREQLLPQAFPEGQLAPLPAEHPVLAGAGNCMDPLAKPRLRRYAAEQLADVAPRLDLMNVGTGAVIVSDLDLTTGLLDSGTYGVVGYTPSYCQSLVKNIILWTLSR